MGLRLLWVSQDFPPDRGGVQTYSAELVRALVQRGLHVEVVAPAVAGADDHDIGFVAPVHRVPVPRDSMPLLGAPAVAARLATRRFDAALHAQWNTAAGSVLARNRGWIRTLAIAAHGRELLWQPGFARAAYDRTRRAALARADAVFAVSHHTAGLVRGLGVAADRVSVVHNGTDPTPFDRPALRQRAAELRAGLPGTIVLTVARLVPHKGIDMMLRALAELAPSQPQLHYVVLGRGRDRERLHALARQLGVAERVRWVEGADFDELGAWLHACDLFALMSRDHAPDVEGFGIALLEAAACGKPALAGRSGGIVDAVQDGATGVLCAPEDPHAIAAALRELIDDASGRARMGQAARARLDASLLWQHAAARVAARLEQLCG
ncbi:MAG: glycosyltransferase family 4 protein [Nannocystaceae bacterium]